MTRRIMKGMVVLICLMALLTVSARGKQEVLPISWADQPPKIDGSVGDWDEVGRVEHRRYHIDYALKNDGEYLYIMFTFKDPEFLSTIDSTGMTVWFNTKAKKKRQSGIKFLKRRITSDTFIRMIEAKEGPLPPEKRAEIEKKEFYTIYQSGVVNRESDTPVPIQMGSGQSPAFGVQADADRTTYEFRIPLQNVEGKTSGIGTTPGQFVALGFEWGGLTQELRDARAKQRGFQSYADRGGVTENVPGADELEGATGVGEGSRGIHVGGGPKKYILWTVVRLADAE